MSRILKALIFLFLVQTVAVVTDPSSAFAQLDHDNDGFLSLQEVMGPENGSANAYEIRNHFNTADADADGKISTVEFPTLFELLNTASFIETENGAALSLLAEEDIHHDGEGSSEEREELEDQEELAELQKMWEEADTDKDDLLSYAEVKKAMEAAPAKFLNLDEDEMLSLSSLLGGYENLGMAAERSFKAADENGDGKLSKEEMQTFGDLMSPDRMSGAGDIGLLQEDIHHDGEGSSEEREEQEERAELQKMWNEADTDKDDLLSYAEVKKAMEAGPAKFLNLDEDEMLSFSSLIGGYDKLGLAAETAFKAADENGDGKLSNEEMETFGDLMSEDS